MIVHESIPRIWAQLSTRVEFPLRGLDLEPFVRTQETPLPTPIAQADPLVLNYESGGSVPLGKVVDMTADNVGQSTGELNVSKGKEFGVVLYFASLLIVSSDSIHEGACWICRRSFH